MSYFPPDPCDERTLHIDQYSGKVLSDISYADYDEVARAVSYGTSLHMGCYFGVANQIVSSAISLGLAVLAIGGFVMWMKRRPARALGAVFPLMGATMLAVWCLARLAFGRARA